MNEEELQQALEWLKHLFIGDGDDVCTLIVPAMGALIDEYVYDLTGGHTGEEVLQKFLDIWKSSIIVKDAHKT